VGVAKRTVVGRPGTCPGGASVVFGELFRDGIRFGRNNGRKSERDALDVRYGRKSRTLCRVGPSALLLYADRNRSDLFSVLDGSHEATVHAFFATTFAANRQTAAARTNLRRVFL